MTPQQEEILHRYQMLIAEIDATAFLGRKRTSQLVNEIDRYVAWCFTKEINPLRFMRFRFQQHAENQGRGGWPALKALVSEPLAAFYIKQGIEEDIVSYEKREKPVYDAVGRENAQLWSFVRDAMLPPSEHEERFRERLVQAGRATVCVTERSHAGLGFDPRSRVCPSCPERITCAGESKREYGFDLVQLRRGDYFKLPKTVQAIIDKSPDHWSHVRVTG